MSFFSHNMTAPPPPGLVDGGAPKSNKPVIRWGMLPAYSSWKTTATNAWNETVNAYQRADANDHRYCSAGCTHTGESLTSSGQTQDSIFDRSEQITLSDGSDGSEMDYCDDDCPPNTPASLFHDKTPEARTLEHLYEIIRQHEADKERLVSWVQQFSARCTELEESLAAANREIKRQGIDKKVMARALDNGQQRRWADETTIHTLEVRLADANEAMGDQTAEVDDLRIAAEEARIQRLRDREHIRSLEARLVTADENRERSQRQIEMLGEMAKSAMADRWEDRKLIGELETRLAQDGHELRRGIFAEKVHMNQLREAQAKHAENENIISNLASSLNEQSTRLAIIDNQIIMLGLQNTLPPTVTYMTAFNTLHQKVIQLGRTPAQEESAKRARQLLEFVIQRRRLGGNQ